MSRTGRRWGWLASVLLCSGCALAPGLHVKVDPDAAAAENFSLIPVTAAVLREQREARASELLAMSAQGLTVLDPLLPSRPYAVGPGDRLAVRVWGVPELVSAKESDAREGLVIGPDGSLYFPYAGLVRVAGLSVEEIRSLLTRRLSVFMRDPQVDVQVAEFRSQRVQVTGEVAQPGVVALDTSSKGVLEALTERGGLSARASRRYVYLSRGAKRHRIPLDRLYGGESGSVSPVLQAGDVIRVPDASDDQIVVLGAVEAPASLPMTGDTVSAISAIAAVGGVSRTTARGGDIYVFRAADTAAPEASPIQVFVIDMRQPQGVLFANHFNLRPRDVVYVATTDLSRFNSVVVQLLPTLQEIFYIDRLTSSNR